MADNKPVSSLPLVWKIIVVVLLVIAVAAVIQIKKGKSVSAPEQNTVTRTLLSVKDTQKSQPLEQTSVTRNPSHVPAVQKPSPVASKPSSTTMEKKTPRLVDLGADKCIPCKMLAPILDELKKEYAGKLQVEFIDVWKNPHAGDPYKIRIIPTQIFFDPSGKELFRHEGFISKEDILSKWKELGFSLEKETTK